MESQPWLEKDHHHGRDHSIITAGGLVLIIAPGILRWGGHARPPAQDDALRGNHIRSQSLAAIN